PQDSFAFCGEICREDSPFQVALLPPGVGEVNMHCLATLRRHVVAEEATGIRHRQAHVAQSALGDPRGRIELVLARNLNTDKVDGGEGLSCCQEKEAFPDPDLNL